jgi:hypothetical protein
MRTLALFLILPTLVQAAEPLRVTWQQVPSVCADRKALIRLASGTRIEGRLMSVSPASFEIEVQRTSNKREVPKGIRTLDRASIGELRVRDKRIKGRVIATIAGFMFAGPAVYSTSARVAVGTGLPVYVGVIALGHMLGRSFDHQSREVVFEPATAASNAGFAAGEALIGEAEDVQGDAHSDQR